MWSNRELATAIWLILFLAFALTKADVRHALARLGASFMRAKILFSTVILVAYTAGIAWLLYEAGIWVPALLKDTILWFILTGFGFFMAAATSSAPHQVLTSSVRDSVKVAVFLEFLVNSHTFSLPAELLLVPIVTIVLMVDAVARTDDKYAYVARLLSWVQMFLGLGIMMSAIRWAAENHASLVSLDTLRGVMLGPILSGLFVPVIYMFVLYVNYEGVFIRLHMGRDKDRQVVRYAKRRILKYAHFRISRVLELTRRAGDIMRLDSTESVDELIQSLEAEGPPNKRMQRTP